MRMHTVGQTMVADDQTTGHDITSQMAKEVKMRSLELEMGHSSKIRGQQCTFVSKALWYRTFKKLDCSLI